MRQMSSRRRNGPDSKFLGNLENGDIVGYMSDLGNIPEGFNVETNQRLCNEQRQCLCNYENSVCKEEALRKVIGGDLEGGLVSAPCSDSALMAKYSKAPLNSPGPEIKDLARPDVRTLADATQGGVNRHIRLTIQPTRPGLADALRIFDILKCPTGAKFDGGKANRRAIVPENERGLVSIMGPIGLFYANTVGASGLVSAGGKLRPPRYTSWK